MSREWKEVMSDAAWARARSWMSPSSSPRLMRSSSLMRHISGIACSVARKGHGDESAISQQKMRTECRGRGKRLK